MNNTVNLIEFNNLNIALMSEKTRKNSFVCMPCGTFSFGNFPANNANFPQGDIRLRLGYTGYISRPDRPGAFGLRHIWEKHGTELGLSCPTEAINFIKNVITNGAAVLIDSNKNPDRPIIIENKVGMAILSVHANTSDVHYSIISAYSRKQHPGTIIATL